jgi:hypothetical protein
MEHMGKTPGLWELARVWKLRLTARVAGASKPKNKKPASADAGFLVTGRLFVAFA